MCSHDERPLYPVSHNALVEGQYYCTEHRYPPCSGCGKRRPDPGTKHRFQAYFCTECQKHAEKVPCTSCGEHKPRSDFSPMVLRETRGKWRCEACCQIQCRGCGEQKHLGAFLYMVDAWCLSIYVYTRLHTHRVPESPRESRESRRHRQTDRQTDGRQTDRQTMVVLGSGRFSQKWLTSHKWSPV